MKLKYILGINLVFFIAVSNPNQLGRLLESQYINGPNPIIDNQIYNEYKRIQQDNILNNLNNNSVLQNTNMLVNPRFLLSRPRM